MQLFILLGLSKFENVKTIKKDKNKPRQIIIEKLYDIAPDESTWNRRSKRLVARNSNIMNILMVQ